jgi:hypothetical protein
MGTVHRAYLLNSAKQVQETGGIEGDTTSLPPATT